MTAYLIFDLIIVAILILFAALGAHRGLILSLCGLLAVVVAFVGASFVARTLSPMVADALEPRFAAAIEEQLNQQIQDSQLHTDLTSDGENVSPDSLPLQDVLDALRDMGFYEPLVNRVDQAVEDGMTEVAASAAAQVAAAIAQSAAYLVLFLICFVLILIIWKLISHGLDLVAKLPGLHFLNKSLGALFGLLKACIILFIAVWLLQFFGGILPREAAEHTYLLRFFMSADPAALLSGLS